MESSVRAGDILVLDVGESQERFVHLRVASTTS